MNVLFVDEGNGAEFDLPQAPVIPAVGDGVYVDHPNWRKVAPHGWTVVSRTFIYKARQPVVRVLLHANRP